MYTGVIPENLHSNSDNFAAENRIFGQTIWVDVKTKGVYLQNDKVLDSQILKNVLLGVYVFCW